MEDWIAVEAAARAIAKLRRSNAVEPNPEPSATERLWAKAALGAAAPYAKEPQSA